MNPKVFEHVNNAELAGQVVARTSLFAPLALVIAIAVGLLTATAIMVALASSLHVVVHSYLCLDVTNQVGKEEVYVIRVVLQFLLGLNLGPSPSECQE